MSRLLANGRAVPQIVKDSRRQSMEVTGGLDADLKARENAKRDNSLEDDCCAFLTGLTGIEINDMMEDLKDGTILCAAINAIKPKAIRKVNKSKMPFKQMENISNFIKACRTLGVPEYALFTTPDLYDGKSIVNVTNGIVALGSKAQTIPGYSGPSLGAKNDAKKGGAKKSKWKIGSGGGGMSKMMMGSAGVMERSSNSTYRDISNGANASGKSVGGGVGKMMQGSAATMERSSNSNYRDISAGANHSGKSTGGMTKLMAGSANTMERSGNQNFRDISSGAKHSGKSTGGSTLMSQGSSNTMERSNNSNYRDITKGAESSGPSLGGSTLMSQGSSNTMERSSNQNFRDITKAAEKPKARPAPPPKPKRSQPFKTAAWDYVAAEGDELEMKAGDKIIVLEAVDGDWGKGKNDRTGEIGLYPMNYVE